ncbi:MAG: SMC-Scp complex subunit ScpB [Lachnospiraceae bacterium]
MTENRYKAAIEAILFTMGEAVELQKIANAIGLEKKETKLILSQLQEEYSSDHRGVQIIALEDSYQMCTKAEYYEYLIQIAKQPKKHVLTDVLMETLSIIAYKQPVTRTEIEKIRGVSCTHVVSKLVEFGLVKELGRLDAPGRPMLFGTTEDFLRNFGIHSLEDLPEINTVQMEEFKVEAENEIVI